MQKEAGAPELLSGLQGGKPFNELLHTVKQLSSIMQQRRQSLEAPGPLLKKLLDRLHKTDQRAQMTRHLTLVQEWWAWLDTLRSMDRLANELHAAGQHAAAAEMLAQVLRLQQIMLGPDLHSTFVSMSTLLRQLDATGQHTEAAERLRQQLLQTQQHVLVLDHPDTTSILRDVAQSFEQLLLQRNFGESVYLCICARLVILSLLCTVRPYLLADPLVM